MDPIAQATLNQMLADGFQPWELDAWLDAQQAGDQGAGNVPVVDHEGWDPHPPPTAADLELAHFWAMGGEVFEVEEWGDEEEEEEDPWGDWTEEGLGEAEQEEEGWG